MKKNCWIADTEKHKKRLYMKKKEEEEKTEPEIMKHWKELPHTSKLVPSNCDNKPCVVRNHNTQEGYGTIGFVWKNIVGFLSVSRSILLFVPFVISFMKRLQAELDCYQK